MIGKIFEATIQDAIKNDLPHNLNYVFFVWTYKGRSIYFSGTRRGDAMEIHIATKNGQRMITKATNEFCKTIFETYEWCSKITGLVMRRGVLSLSLRCGFSVIGEVVIDGDKVTIIERCKNG